MSRCFFLKTDDVAPNGMSAINYDQWKVNKFCLLSHGIISVLDFNHVTYVA